MSDPRVLTKGDKLTMAEVTATTDDNGYWWLINQRSGLRLKLIHGMQFLYAPGAISADGAVLVDKAAPSMPWEVDDLFALRDLLTRSGMTLRQLLNEMRDAAREGQSERITI